MVSIYHTTASSMVSISHDNKQHGINITPQQAAWYQYHTTTSSMLSISHANKQHGTNISHHSKQHGINITPYQAACYQYHTITSSMLSISHHNKQHRTNTTAAEEKKYRSRNSTRDCPQKPPVYRNGSLALLLAPISPPPWGLLYQVKNGLKLP